MAVSKRCASLSVNTERDHTMKLLPEMSDEERRAVEHDRKLAEALQEAQDAQRGACEAIEELSRMLGFPMTRSVRLEDDRAIR